MSLHANILIPVLALVLATTSLAAQDAERVELEGFTYEAKAMVDRMIEALDRVESYADEGVVQWGVAMGGMSDQDYSFVYVKPKWFRLNTQMYELVSDGKEFTVYARNMRRYTTRPAKGDLDEQIRRYRFGAGGLLGSSELLVSKNPRKVIADHIEDLEVIGPDSVDGERCIKLTGKLKTGGGFMGGQTGTMTLWLREPQLLIRRAEMKFSPQESDDDEVQTMGMVMEYTLVFDAKNMRVNEPIDPKQFTFDPPKKSKKVDRFYNEWMASGDTAVQFELSGKPAPDFELEAARGGWVSLASLRGKVVVLNFLQPPNPISKPVIRLDSMEKLRREFADKDVEVISIHRGSGSDDLLNDLNEQAIDMPVLLDEGGDTIGKYFEQQWSWGIVLVSKDGVVQGKHRGNFGANAKTDALKSDIEKLLKGETLPGGEPMTEEQITEAEFQRGSFYMSGSAEPLNEEFFVEAWSVKTRSQQNITFGGSSANMDRDGFWIRDKDNIKLVNYAGKILAELKLPEVDGNNMAQQDQFAVGAVGARLGTVLMTTVTGEEKNQWGMAQPEAVRIIAADQEGRELWQIELEVENYQMPQHLALANLDGRGADELIFFHEGAVWVIDERGEVAARLQTIGWPHWLRAEDRDGDRKAEIYLRTHDRLQRYDYQPRR